MVDAPILSFLVVVLVFIMAWILAPRQMGESGFFGMLSALDGQPQLGGGQPARVVGPQLNPPMWPFFD